MDHQDYFTHSEPDSTPEYPSKTLNNPWAETWLISYVIQTRLAPSAMRQSALLKYSAIWIIVSSILPRANISGMSVKKVHTDLFITLHYKMALYIT